MYYRFWHVVSIAIFLSSTILLFGLYGSPRVRLRQDSVHEFPATTDEPAAAADISNDGEEISVPTNDTSTAVPQPDDHDPHTKLVLAALSTTDTDWVQPAVDELPNVSTAIYITNSTDAPLHTPLNKGHEAMAYLTYLIDFYNELPEISIFMHAHPTAWHNNPLLSYSTPSMLEHLDRNHILSVGYFNLRCHWSPGCPHYIDPTNSDLDKFKPEQKSMATAWRQLFPATAIPASISQPCCSQFAVSRTTIQLHPLSYYVHLRDWLIGTSLHDSISGRIFEYVWQYVFLNETEHCPDPRLCYCEGYGVCFDDPATYNDATDLMSEIEWCSEGIQSWKALQQDTFVPTLTPPQPQQKEKEPMTEEEFAEEQRAAEEKFRTAMKEAGYFEWGDDAKANTVWLEEKMEAHQQELADLMDNAFEVGRDPGRRAAAIEAAKKDPISA